MATGSTLVLVKQALVSSLRLRTGLAGVQVLYGPDDLPVGDDHVHEASIWLGDTTWIESVIPVWNAGTKKVDETYQLAWIVQVIKADGSTQEAADVRAVALLAELQQALAEMPRISDEIHWAEIKMRRHVTGQVVGGPGHGSRFEGVVEVKARLAP